MGAYQAVNHLSLDTNEVLDSYIPTDSGGAYLCPFCYNDSSLSPKTRQHPYADMTALCKEVGRHLLGLTSQTCLACPNPTCTDSFSTAADLGNHFIPFHKIPVAGKKSRALFAESNLLKADLSNNLFSLKKQTEAASTAKLKEAAALGKEPERKVSTRKGWKGSKRQGRKHVQDDTVEHEQAEETEPADEAQS